MKCVYYIKKLLNNDNEKIEIFSYDEKNVNMIILNKYLSIRRNFKFNHEDFLAYKTDLFELIEKEETILFKGDDYLVFNNCIIFKNDKILRIENPNCIWGSFFSKFKKKSFILKRNITYKFEDVELVSEIRYENKKFYLNGYKVDIRFLESILKRNILISQRMDLFMDSQTKMRSFKFYILDKKEYIEIKGVDVIYEIDNYLFLSYFKKVYMILKNTNIILKEFELEYGYQLTHNLKFHFDFKDGTYYLFSNNKIFNLSKGKRINLDQNLKIDKYNVSKVYKIQELKEGI